MTTTTSLGAVPLLGGVVLALTPPSTKNPLRAMVVIGGFLQRLRSSTSLGITMKSKLLCHLGDKLGNDNIRDRDGWDHGNGTGAQHVETHSLSLCTMVHYSTLSL
uniref:Secreted protein n=2 Tax=Oryza TaxID=4527 RepID=A0A0D3FBB6_9ORYZ